MESKLLTVGRVPKAERNLLNESREKSTEFDIGPQQRSVPRKRKRNSKARATVYTCIRNQTQRPMLGARAASAADGCC